jgi:hypothetical protein
MESHGGMILAEENEELREKPVPVPLCPPWIPHGLTGSWTQASIMGGHRLTAWAMAWLYVLRADSDCTLSQTKWHSSMFHHKNIPLTSIVQAYIYHVITSCRWLGWPPMALTFTCSNFNTGHHLVQKSKGGTYLIQKEILQALFS